MKRVELGRETFGNRLLSSALLALCAIVLLMSAGHAQPDPTQSAAANVAPPEGSLRVTIVGSGGGPPVDLETFGPSILIQAGSEMLLFDCGRGATIRLTELGVPLTSVSKVFLTHLHSDHVIDIPDLYLATWGPPNGRRVPFEVWGPPGTTDMMEHIRAAFAADIDSRGGNPDSDAASVLRLEAGRQEGLTVLSHDVDEGVIYERNGVTVTAFRVEHGMPAFGYRVDYRDHSVAMSGDTAFSENLIRFARGVDLVIHEAVDADFIRRALRIDELPQEQRDAFLEAVVDGHTLPEEAGEVFSRVETRLAVYAHATRTPTLITQTRQNYSGPLELAEDLMVIEIGDDITVERPGE